MIPGLMPGRTGSCRSRTCVSTRVREIMECASVQAGEKWRMCVLNPGRLIRNLNSSLSSAVRVAQDPTAKSQAFCPKLSTSYSRPVPPKL